MTRRSPVHLSVEKDQPVHLVLSPSKTRTSSPKRTPKRNSSPKRGSSPVKEKPWIPAPCKTSKNKFTWAEEPTLMDNVSSFKNKVADLSTDIDYLQTKADLRAKEHQLSNLRDNLDASLTEKFERDREIDLIQSDLLQTELENERLRLSLRDMAEGDLAQRKSQTKLQMEREGLLKRLVQAEADSLAAKREMSALHSNLREIKMEKDVCQEDTDKLARQRELLLEKCADAENSNRKLRDELAENQLKLADTGKLRSEHEKVLERLTQSDGMNRELRTSLATMDKQISQLSRQISVEKEEAEAYRHLQRTSELNRSKTAEQLQDTLTRASRLEKRLEALESDMELEKREHNHTKGLLAGVKEKSHSEKEALRDKVRSYRDRALRSEEALEAVSAQLEAKSSKLKTLEEMEEAWTSKIDTLVVDNTEMGEAIDTLKRKLYVSEEQSGTVEQELSEELAKLRVESKESAQKVKLLESKKKQLEISLDSLTDQLQKKESDAAAEAVASDAEVDRLKRDVELFQDRLRESEELLARFRTDNALLQQRVELAERDRGAIQHGNYMELEKVRAEYQSKIDELSTYPERLSSAEARCADAESTADALRSQLADRNTTVADLQSKIDLFQGQIGKLKEKFHSVNEDNIELSNKAQSHERKVLEADLHNKNLMDLVNKKDDSVEQHQLQVDGELATLPPVPTADPPSPPSVSDNNAEEDTETETESTDESEEEVDWSEMLKNAESNRERLGLDNMESDGESSVDEEGNRYIKKKATNGLTSADIMNRMATNQFLGFDEFGRPIGGKPNGIGGMSGKKGHKNRSMLFGVDGGKRNKTKGANNRGAGGKERSGRNGGGRRAKKGGNMALLGF